MNASKRSNCATCGRTFPTPISSRVVCLGCLARARTAARLRARVFVRSFREQVAVNERRMMLDRRSGEDRRGGIERRSLDDRRQTVEVRRAKDKRRGPLDRRRSGRRLGPSDRRICDRRMELVG